MLPKLCLFAFFCLGAVQPVPYTPSPLVQQHCPSTLPRDRTISMFGNKCYRFIYQRWNKVDFNTAEQECKKDNGTLAMIENLEENAFLTKQMHQFNRDDYEHATWIGLQHDMSPFSSNNSSPRGFKWLDGSSFVNDDSIFIKKVFETPYSSDFLSSREYQYFKGKKIDGKINFCVALIADNDEGGKWEVRECKKKLKSYICQYETDYVTPTTTTTPATTATPDQSNKDACPVFAENPDAVQVYGDKCYFINANYKLDFHDAEKYCQQKGGLLANPKTRNTNHFLHFHAVFTHGLHVGDENLWIGLRENKWSDGTQADFRGFSKSPVNVNRYSGKNGACWIMSAQNSQWNNAACDDYAEKHGCICEFRLLNNEESYSGTTKSSVLGNATTTTATVKPSQHRTPSTTDNSNPETTPKTTKPPKKKCYTITCEKDCGLDGFKTDPVTTCRICECDS